MNSRFNYILYLPRNVVSERGPLQKKTSKRFFNKSKDDNQLDTCLMITMKMNYTDAKDVLIRSLDFSLKI